MWSPLKDFLKKNLGRYICSFDCFLSAVRNIGHVAIVTYIIIVVIMGVGDGGHGGGALAAQNSGKYFSGKNRVKFS